MATKTRFPFTKTALEALPLPTDGRVTYRDAKTPGLSLRVGSSGNKSFYWYRKLDGRPVRILLGKFPSITVEHARKTCERLSGDVADGKNPQAERRRRREEPTLGDLFQYWMESHAKPHKRTWQADQRQYDAYLSPWAGRRLSSITKADVVRLQLQIAQDRGKYIANKVLALVRAMYNRASEVGFEGPNPTARIKKFPEQKRDRFLHGHELKAFFQALAAEPNETLRDYFAVSLLTGARKSNVLAMRWGDIDVETRLWRIPQTKSGVPVIVPLTAPVLAILESRREATNGHPWVFPSWGKTGHLAEPKSAWKRVVDRAGLVDVRPHDLRRSLGSWMAMTGAGLPIVGKMLGHSQPSTTAIYARLAVDSVRQAAEVATTAMLEAGGVKLLEQESRDAKEGVQR